MVVDRLGGDEQLRADLGVGLPGADQREDLALAPGQAERMLARGGAPTGIERMSGRRSAPRMMRAAAAAPRSWQMSRAWRRQAPRRHRAWRAASRAADLVPQLGRAAPVATKLQPYGSASSPRALPEGPVRRTQAAASPHSHGPAASEWKASRAWSSQPGSRSAARMRHGCLAVGARDGLLHCAAGNLVLEPQRRAVRDQQPAARVHFLQQDAGTITSVARVIAQGPKACERAFAGPRPAVRSRPAKGRARLLRNLARPASEEA
jgi:hypothetical protein